MAVPESQKRAKEKYRREKRDQIALEVPKGKREAYRQIADELGVSMARLVQFSVEEFAQNHKTGVPRELLEKGEQALAERDKILLERFNSLPERAQRNFMRLMGALVVKCKEMGGGKNGDNGIPESLEGEIQEAEA